MARIPHIASGHRIRPAFPTCGSPAEITQVAKFIDDASQAQGHFTHAKPFQPAKHPQQQANLYDVTGNNVTLNSIFFEGPKHVMRGSWELDPTRNWGAGNLPGPISCAASVNQGVTFRFQYSVYDEGDDWQDTATTPVETGFLTAAIDYGSTTPLSGELVFPSGEVYVGNGQTFCLQMVFSVGPTNPTGSGRDPTYADLTAYVCPVIDVVEYQMPGLG